MSSRGSKNPETIGNKDRKGSQNRDSRSLSSSRAGSVRRSNDGQNEQSLSPSQDDDEAYLDAGEALPFSKNQGLTEDDAPLPNAEPSFIFEREGASEQPYHSYTYNPPVCLVAMPAHSPGQNSSSASLEDTVDNGNYMRSITSLVGGGEGPIRSLSDILVWTETAMGTATELLNASHTSVTDILYGTGTTLRSMTSLLGGARSALTDGILNGTGTMLRTMSQLLENIERRTIEGIRYAFRFMTHHISPRRGNTNCDNE
ncbi:testis-expressed protein 44 [Sarcophilus harrisii]|uniref:Testis expressed 44 n=1 Tax=Sarcophilus harrisii TaxID=9305 RepID=A0A7N4UYV0_SARHA|nr:testis-expressed protein 44 [Sarcophilus harrisii]